MKMTFGGLGGSSRGIYIRLGPGSGSVWAYNIKSAQTDPAMCNNETCLLFDSKHGTPCLPFRNVETSTLLQWSIILRDLELNASSEERITQMGAFICTLSLTSGGSIEQGTREHSMFKDSTLMYRRLAEHRKTVMTMQSKTETLWLGDLNDLLEAEWHQLVMCGLKSSMQRMSQSFGRYANHWLHVHWSLNSHNSEPSLPGSFPLSESRMKLRRELSSTRLGWLNSMNGYDATLQQSHLEVSELAALGSYPVARPPAVLLGCQSLAHTPPSLRPPASGGPPCSGLTSICRTKKITCGIRAFPNGQDHLGPLSRKACLLRRPL